MRVLRNMKNAMATARGAVTDLVNAFNPLKKWYDTDAVGIDTGITMLMAENARSGFVWDTFMKNPEARRGMERAGFEPTQSTGGCRAALITRNNFTLQYRATAVFYRVCKTVFRMHA